GAHLPVADEESDAGRLQVVTEGLDQALEDGIADEASVAVLVRRDVRAPRRDDEGGVADDEVEPLADDRFEEAAGPQIDVGIVEGRRESGEGERPLRGVGRDDRGGGGPTTCCRRAPRARRCVAWWRGAVSGGRGGPRSERSVVTTLSEWVARCR